MSRVFLFFATGLVALMAGALFYAARLPVQHAEPSAAIEPRQQSADPTAVTHLTFTLPDAAGEPRQLSDWDGKSRILNFWATWCAPCRREIPLLKTFQDEHAGNGFQVIGIAVDFPEEVSRYAENAEFNYPILVGQEDAMAVAESSGIQFMALPFTMFVARDGQYLGAYMGELHAEQLDAVASIMSRFDAGDLTRESAVGAFSEL